MAHYHKSHQPANEITFFFFNFIRHFICWMKFFAGPIWYENYPFLWFNEEWRAWKLMVINYYLNLYKRFLILERSYNTANNHYKFHCIIYCLMARLILIFFFVCMDKMPVSLTAIRIISYGFGYVMLVFFLSYRSSIHLTE